MDVQDMQVEEVGLVGLGLVGTALARLLLERGIAVLGFDIDAGRGRILQEQGVSLAGSPRHVAQQVNVLILSLPDSSAVCDVLTGSDGILQSKELPAYCIDTTTADPDDTVRVAQQCAERGMLYLDATISGSSKQIAGRQGVFMVGGRPEAFDACRPLLGVFSDNVFHLGPSGSGARAKLATNLILGLNRVALAEGLVFAEALGLDLENFLDLLKRTPAYSAAMDSKGAKMIHEDFAPESRIRQHYKDVRLILKHAEKAGQELPLSKTHADLLDAAIAAGDADLDNAAIIRELRRREFNLRS